MRSVGPYRITAELGRGGMGVVYRAHQASLGRDVALKLLHPGRVDPDAVLRFAREIRLSAQLHHPNLVALLDGGTVDGQLYLVMELIEGVSLEQQVGRPLPVADVLVIGAALADAMAYLHERKIVHRDVKPANVLFTSDGTAKLNDFGLAIGSTTTIITRTGEILGTPAYMPPEALLAESLTPASDVWSLGTVLYQMVTGELPFPRDNLDMSAWMSLVLNKATPDPAAGRPGIPPPLVALIRQSLEKKPDRRPHAAEMARILHELDADGGNHTRPGATVMRRGVRPSGHRVRRWARPAFVAGVLLFVLGALMGRPKTPVPRLHDEVYERITRDGFASTAQWARARSDAGPAALLQLAFVETLQQRSGDAFEHTRRATLSGPLWMTQVARGQLANRMGRVDEARECVARALELEPGSVDAHADWLSYAQSDMTTSEFLEQQRILTAKFPHSMHLQAVFMGARATHGDPGPYPDIIRRLEQEFPRSRMLYAMRATEAEGSKDLARAESLLRRALELDPTDIPMQVALASFIGRHRDVTQAISTWRQLRVNTEDLPSARLALATALDRLHRRDEAQRELSQVDYWDRLGPGDMVSFAQILDRIAQPETSLAVLRLAQARYSHYALPFAMAADLLQRKGWSPAVESMFRKAIDLAGEPDKSEYALRLSALLINAKRHKDALPLLESVRHARVDPTQVSMTIVSCLRHIGRDDEAIVTLRTAFAGKPDPDLLRLLGVILMERNDPAGAEAAIRQIFTRYKPIQSDYELLCRSLLKQKRPAEALAVVEAAQKVAPTALSFLHIRPQILVALDRWPEAAQAQKVVVDLRPDVTELRVGYASMLLRVGDVRAAEAEARKASQLNPQALEIHELLCTILYHQGRIEEAGVELERSLAPSRTLPAIYGTIVENLRLRGRPSQAVTLLRHLYRQTPPNVTSYLALLQNLQGLTAEEHIAELKQACQAVPASVPLKQALVTIFVRRGSTDEAISLLREMVQLEPNDAAPLTQLVFALHRRGDESSQMTERLLALRTVTEFDLLEAGRIAAKHTHLELAERCFRRAITLAPDSVNARKRLRDCLLLQGKLQEASTLDAPQRNR